MVFQCIVCGAPTGRLVMVDDVDVGMCTKHFLEGYGRTKPVPRSEPVVPAAKPKHKRRR